MSLRRGVAETIDNDLGLVLRLTRWDDDHLTVEIRPTDNEGNGVKFEAEFGIYGHLGGLQAIFADKFPVQETSE